MAAADSGGAVTADARHRKREADRRYRERHRERLAAKNRERSRERYRRRSDEQIEDRRKFSREWMRRKRAGLPTAGLAEHLRAELATTDMCECGLATGSCVPCGGSIPVGG